jgi:hypothetical protein
MLRIRWTYKLIVSLGCFVVVAAQQPVSAQKNPPLGYIRIWHFAPSLKAQVSISLVGGGSSRPIILARRAALSDVMNYRDVPVGQYKLMVRAAASDLSVTDASPEVLPAVNITVGDKTFQTIILQDQGATAKIFLANDTISGAGIPRGGKRLRIFNFAAGQDATLKISPSNEVIAAPVAAGMSEHVFPNNPGTLMLVMSNKLKNGFEAEQYLEADFTSIDSISALIMFDRYGRLTVLVRPDGKTG